MAKREWAESVDGMDVQKIKEAFEKIKASGESFPPALPKFLSYCKGDDWEHKGGAYKPFQAALPKPMNRALGREALARLRNKTRGAENE